MCVFFFFRVVLFLPKPYCGASWDPLLRDAVGRHLPATKPPRCHKLRRLCGVWYFQEVWIVMSTICRDKDFSTWNTVPLLHMSYETSHQWLLFDILQNFSSLSSSAPLQLRLHPPGLLSSVCPEQHGSPAQDLPVQRGRHQPRLWQVRALVFPSVLRQIRQEPQLRDSQRCHACEMQAANECLHALCQEVQSRVHTDVSWEGQQVRYSQCSDSAFIYLAYFIYPSSNG